MMDEIMDNGIAEIDEEFDPGEYLQGGEYRDLDVITGEIIVYKQQAGMAILEIGRRLIEAKAQLGHGEWLPYLRDRVDFSRATANRMMRLAKEYSNCSPVSNLGAKKALQLLAFSPVERDEFLSQNDVENMSSRELQEAIRARKDAEAARDAAMAEAARTQQDLLDQLEEQQRVYDVDLGAVEDKLAAALAREEQASEKAKQAEKRISEIEKYRPADPAEIAAAKKAAAEEARAAAEKAAGARMEELRREAEEAADALLKAERDAAAQEQQRDETQRTIEAMGEENARLKKQLSMSSSEMAVFRVHFEAMQERANKMIAVIDGAAASGQAELAAKMRAAVRACCEAIIAGVGGD